MQGGWAKQPERLTVGGEHDRVSCAPGAQGWAQVWRLRNTRVRRKKPNGCFRSDVRALVRSKVSLAWIAELLPGISERVIYEEWGQKRSAWYSFPISE